MNKLNQIIILVLLVVVIVLGVLVYLDRRIPPKSDTALPKPYTEYTSKPSKKESPIHYDTKNIDVFITAIDQWLAAGSHTTRTGSR